MHHFQFLHLSDLHITYNKHYSFSQFNSSALEAVARHAFKYRNSLDAILVSGDIADFGLQEDLQKAFDFFSLPSTTSSPTPWLYGSIKKRPTLQACSKPIVLLPGNHDRYNDCLLRKPKSNKFEDVFSSYWPVNDKVYGLPLPDDVSPRLLVVCADFSLARVRDATVLGGHWGQGKIYKKRLTLLSKKTKDLQSEYRSIPVIWMIHFAPKFKEFKNSFDEKLSLINEDKLIEKAEKLGVERIFCGHTHEEGKYTTGNSGKVDLYSAGTSSCTKPKDETGIYIRRLIIDGNRIVGVKTLPLHFDPDDNSFKPSKKNNSTK